jgi:hypothetical protein
VTPPSVSPGWGLCGVHFTSPHEGWVVGDDYANRKGVLLHYSIWPTDFDSKLSIKGFTQDSRAADGWCHIYPNGTFLLYDESIGRSYTGTYTYTIVPGGKNIYLTLDQNGLSQMQAMLLDWVTEMMGGAGITIQNISLSFDSVSISKGTIQKKTNAPSNVMVKITGTVSALVDGAPKSGSFSYQGRTKYYSP